MDFILLGKIMEANIVMAVAHWGQGTIVDSISWFVSWNAFMIVFFF